MPKKSNRKQGRRQERKPNASEARQPKPAKVPKPPSRFAPSAFIASSPEAVQALCNELATLAAARFADLTGTTWARVASSVVQQLRETGHDLRSFDESSDFQEWQAVLHHPRGEFSLFVTFRAPAAVEVSWTVDGATFVGRA